MSNIKTLFVVSDVHGFYTELKTALDEVGFDAENPEHILVCCGDYFDRGTENLKVLQFFERLKHKVLLRGNHEDMLLGIFDSGQFKPHNYLNGTVQTITEFFGKYALDEVTNTVDFSGKTRMLDRVCDFIGETRDHFETEHYVFTHGWLPTVQREDGIFIDENWRQASPDTWKKARWIKWNEMYEQCDRVQGKTIVCGHVPSFYAAKFDKTREPQQTDIFYGQGVTVVDAGTYSTGKINVLVIENESIN